MTAAAILAAALRLSPEERRALAHQAMRAHLGAIVTGYALEGMEVQPDDPRRRLAAVWDVGFVKD